MGQGCSKGSACSITKVVVGEAAQRERERERELHETETATICFGVMCKYGCVWFKARPGTSGKNLL